MEKLSISDLSIVLVEPSDTQRKIISGMLTKEHVKQIDTAANIAEAKKMVELSPFTNEDLNYLIRNGEDKRTFLPTAPRTASFMR